MAVFFKNHGLESLKQIIAGCIRNERRYQQVFYERFAGFASRVVFRYIYHYEKANDIVTDSFVKAFCHFQKFRMPEEQNDLEKTVMAWLKKIMINSSIDELRKQKMIPEIGGINESCWLATNTNDDADKLLLYKDLVMMVRELPPAYRVVFNLYVIDGFSHTEIAEQMNIQVGTSKSHLSRAKTLLQERIKNMEIGKLCRS